MIHEIGERHQRRFYCLCGASFDAIWWGPRIEVNCRVCGKQLTYSEENRVDRNKIAAFLVEESLLSESLVAGVPFTDIDEARREAERVVRRTGHPHLLLVPGRRFELQEQPVEEKDVLSHRVFTDAQYQRLDGAPRG